MKKKILLLGLAAALSLSVCGCGKSEEPQTAEEAMEQAKSAMSQIGKAMDKKKEEEQKQFEKNEKKLDNAVIEDENSGKAVLKSYAVLKDKDSGSAKLTLIADYTNQSGYDMSFSSFAAGMTLYQDGVMLNTAYSPLNKDDGTVIKQDAKIEVVYSYSLRNDTSDVEFEVDGNTVYTLKLN